MSSYSNPSLQSRLISNTFFGSKTFPAKKRRNYNNQLERKLSNSDILILRGYWAVEAFLNMKTMLLKIEHPDTSNEIWTQINHRGESVGL